MSRGKQSVKNPNTLRSRRQAEQPATILLNPRVKSPNPSKEVVRKIYRRNRKLIKGRPNAVDDVPYASLRQNDNSLPSLLSTCEAVQC